jgi:uncharacterized protein
MSTTASVAKSSSGEPAWARSGRDGVTLCLWVVPGAQSTVLDGERDGALRLRVAAPAREGLANAEVVRFLAGRAGVRRADVEVTGGRHTRRKTVRVRGVTLPDLLEALGPCG